jgi:hypothetical protein
VNQIEEFAANNGREVREPLFDTYTVAAATAMPLRVILFGDPSASGVGATKPEQTNLTEIGKLPFPQAHRVYGVRLAFIGMLAADIYGIAKKYVLKLNVSGTTRLTLPLVVSDAPKVIGTVASDIIDHAEVRMDLPEGYAIDLASGQPFFVELVGSVAHTTITTNGLGATIKVMLEGFHTLPL